jgi:hypothetical protein
MRVIETLHPWWRTWRGRRNPGVDFQFVSSISFKVKKSAAKENARVQSLPVHAADAWCGTKGENISSKTVLARTFYEHIFTNVL